MGEAEPGGLPKAGLVALYLLGIGASAKADETGRG